MKWLKDGLSLDEFKTSMLVLAFILFSVIGSYAYITTGDITGNWLDLLTTLIYIIGGVNAVKSLSEIVPKKKEDKEEDDSEAKG